MRNKLDGGEAVVQAFRCLDMDYVMASPGTEWGAVWEAFARQKVSNAPGPVYFSCAHETLAVDLAIGYTGYTGRMQGVMLHTGVGAAARLDGDRRGPAPGHSDGGRRRRGADLRRAGRVPSRPAMAVEPERGRRAAQPRRAAGQVVEPGLEPGDPVRTAHPGRRDGAADAVGADLHDRPDRDPARRLDAARPDPRRSAGPENAAAGLRHRGRRRASGSSGAAGHRRGVLGARSGCL